MTDSIYSRLQCPQMMGQGWGSSVRLCSRMSGVCVGGHQQWRQEVKIAPASRPSKQARPRPGPGLGSRSYSGAWESPWRKVPSHPPCLPPPSSSSCRSLPSLQRKEGRAGEGRGKAGEGGGGWGVRRAGSPLPATPGRVQWLPLEGPWAQHWEDGTVNLCAWRRLHSQQTCSHQRAQALTHLILEAPTAMPASSRGTSCEKTLLLRPLGP